MNNTYIIRLSDGQDTVIELPKPKVEKDGKVWVFDHEGEQYTLHHDAFFMDQWTWEPLNTMSGMAPKVPERSASQSMADTSRREG